MCVPACQRRSGLDTAICELAEVIPGLQSNEAVMVIEAARRTILGLQRRARELQRVLVAGLGDG